MFPCHLNEGMEMEKNMNYVSCGLEDESMGNRSAWEGGFLPHACSELSRIYLYVIICSRKVSL